MENSMEKTNAMRILERGKAEYKVHEYEGGALSGVEVAATMGEDVDSVYKTLVTVGSPRKYYVFVIPVAAELDLKRRRKRQGKSRWRCSLKRSCFRSRAMCTAAVRRSA